MSYSAWLPGYSAVLLTGLLNCLAWILGLATYSRKRPNSSLLANGFSFLVSQVTMLKGASIEDAALSEEFTPRKRQYQVAKHLIQEFMPSCFGTNGGRLLFSFLTKAQSLWTIYLRSSGQVYPPLTI